MGACFEGRGGETTGVHAVYNCRFVPSSGRDQGGWNGGSPGLGGMNTGLLGVKKHHAEAG